MNDLLRAATEAQRNAERVATWKSRYFTRVGRYPDGDIGEHRRAAGRYLDALRQLRPAPGMARQPARPRPWRALLAAVRPGKRGALCVTRRGS